MDLRVCANEALDELYAKVELMGGRGVSESMEGTSAYPKEGEMVPKWEAIVEKSFCIFVSEGKDIFLYCWNLFWIENFEF